MNGHPLYHRRRSLRLAGYDYTRAGAYFITICTFVRQEMFGEVIDGNMYLNAWGRIVEEEWLAAEQHRVNVILDEYIIMPNHLHAVLWIIPDPVSADGIARGSDATSQIYKGHDTEAIDTPEDTIEHDVYGATPKEVETGEMRSATVMPHDASRTSLHCPRRPDPIITDTLLPAMSPDRSTIRTFGKPVSRSLWTIVGSYKASVTRRLMPGRGSHDDPLWQDRYYDHIVRSEDDLQRIRAYIRNNPMRWQTDCERDGKERHNRGIQEETGDGAAMVIRT